jgi:hypothetical protein
VVGGGRESYDDWHAENLVVLARKWQAGDVGKVGVEGIGGRRWERSIVGCS